MKLRATLLLLAVATSMLMLASPAGAAASSVGRVTVSNPSPARASTIAVRSNGWRPGGVVAISLAGRVLGHATADASGAIRIRVSVPDHAPRFASLAVIGSATAGVPQQIVTNLTIVGNRNAPAPQRPWTAVFLLLAIATALLLASVRSDAYAAPSSGPPSRGGFGDSGLRSASG